MVIKTTFSHPARSALFQVVSIINKAVPKLLTAPADGDGDGDEDGDEDVEAPRPGLGQRQPCRLRAWPAPEGNAPSRPQIISSIRHHRQHGASLGRESKLAAQKLDY